MSYGQISETTYNFLTKHIPGEKVQLHTNTNLVLVGEVLYYKVYNQNLIGNSPSPVSKVNYVELIGKNNNVIFKHKLKVVNNVSFGDFFLPETIQTGHYKLISYTHWSLNNATNRFSQKDIYIINPYKISNLSTPIYDKEAVEISKSNSLLLTRSNNQNVLIKTDKDLYRTRDKVILSLDNTLADLKNVSVSIRKIDSIQIKRDNLQTKITETEHQYYLPELRGEILSGSIKAKNENVTIHNKVLSLSIPGKDFTFKNATTNSNGEFFFVLDKNYVNPEAYIQIDEENANDYTITINTFKFDAYNQLEFHPMVLNETIKDWLEQRSINNQIENAFSNVKPDSLMINKIDSLFYHPKAIHYKLDDFNRFKTIKETFVEIIFASSIVEQNGHSEFIVYDYENNEANKVLHHVKPLVLVDGILIKNNNDIIEYNAYDIDTISIVTGHYIYGSKIYNGIIAFKTKNEDFSIRPNDHIKQIQLQQFQKDKHYYKPDYNNKGLERIPDYRTQLFWEPYLNLKENKTLAIYTSDIKGTFEITLEGYTKSGTYIKATNHFLVN